MTSWREAGLPEEEVALVGPEEGAQARFLDIRQRSEFEGGHIPGAVHAELGRLDEIAGSLPAEPLTLHCGHQERAMTGASVLARRGRKDLAVLRGGPEGWSRAAARPLVRETPARCR